MRYGCALVLGLVLAGSAASDCSAFWLDAFFDHCHRGAQKNRQWPSPYLCADRMYAHAPFDTMIRNGWRRQNLLGAHHFNEDATQLTQAGRLKVRWILTQTPPAYRRVFIEQSIRQETTQQRIATAQKFAGEVATGADLPQVTQTHIVSEGRPAATVDFVNSQFRDNMRTPVLPAATTGSAGGQ
ncbi:MAG: hypothetical protein AAF790_11550 [Planctomycetota bacterium]